jgi:HlyD family secretion protein
MSESQASAASPQHRFGRPGRRRGWLWLVVVAALAGGGYWYWSSRQSAEPEAPPFVSELLSRGDIEEVVRATGTVQPLLQVQVGAQVSGRIASVAVDYNSVVKKGDLLAEIDPQSYEARAGQSRANLLAASAQRGQSRANLTLAEQTLARAQDLRSQQLNAQADVDAAVAQRDAARAAVALADAQIAQARASLEEVENQLTFTRILAPIDGIVASRAIDPGQTVAASFQTPTLFVIANDLTRMRVIANVDEANIGKLREGMGARAKVEAYPREEFPGRITSIRINPTTTSGVVTYETVIEVANPDLRLRPGMTATITVVTASVTEAWLVPNAALRYRPSDTVALPEASGQGSGAEPPRTAGGAGRARASAGAGEGRIYVVRAGRAVALPVRPGITDGTRTQVEGSGLAADVEVIVDETDATARSGSKGGFRGPRVF